MRNRDAFSEPVKASQDGDAGSLALDGLPVDMNDVQ